jgi:hypothetical protein
MRGGMTKEEILALLQKEMAILFPEIDPSHMKIRTIRRDTAADIRLTHCKETTAHYRNYFPVVRIDFSDNMMKVQLLTSCSPMTGREILSRFITLAKHLRLSYVTLHDASELYVHPSAYGRESCMLSLAYVRILLKGESWYQSLGFVSGQNAADHAHNERIRAMPLRDFVKEIVDREKTGSAEELLASLLETFPELHEDMPVSDAIQKMLATVNEIGETVCDSRAFALLKRLIDGCKRKGEDGMPLLHYQNENRTLRLNAPNTSS